MLRVRAAGIANSVGPNENQGMTTPPQGELTFRAKTESSLKNGHFAPARGEKAKKFLEARIKVLAEDILIHGIKP